MLARASHSLSAPEPVIAERRQLDIDAAVSNLRRLAVPNAEDVAPLAFACVLRQGGLRAHGMRREVVDGERARAVPRRDPCDRGIVGVEQLPIAPAELRPLLAHAD